MSNFAHNGDAFYPLHRPGQAVPASPNLPRIEEEILAYWKQDDTFRASVENRATGRNGDNEFVFYDGPPFANGLPHYGHLITGYAKDAASRPKKVTALSAALVGIPTVCPQSLKPSVS